MSIHMTKAEREAFLAEAHVGVFAVADEGRAPLTLPIWYAYEPGGEISIVTEAGSRKAKLLERAKRFSLCAQTEAPPYKYVSVEGPIVSTGPADVERDIRPLAHRYLGKDFGDRYVAETTGDRSTGASILVRMRPERWNTIDYAKQFEM